FMPPPPPVLYTLSLHDALPISTGFASGIENSPQIPRTTSITDTGAMTYSLTPRLTSSRYSVTSFMRPITMTRVPASQTLASSSRSEEHTSELQSLRHLVCRLLL